MGTEMDNTDRMDVVRIGLVGAGGMGSFHARTLASLAGVRVVAVADPYEPNARAVCESAGAEIIDDPFALIEQAPIDALVIASPDDTHAAFAIAAIERGIPTLCEKPLSTSVDDAIRVLDAEAAAGRRLVQMGFMREYDPAHRQLVDELPDLGRIVSIRATHRNTPSPARPIEVIVGQSIVHDIHSLRFISGAEIDSVHASTASIDGSIRHVVVTCGLSNGAHAVLEFDDAGFAYEVSVEVIAEHGDVVTGSPLRPVRRRAGSIDVHLGPDWFGWFADAYRHQDQTWVDSIRSGIAVGPSTHDGLAAHVVVEAILRSIGSGETTRPDAVPPSPFG